MISYNFMGKHASRMAGFHCLAKTCRAPEYHVGDCMLKPWPVQHLGAAFVMTSANG